MLKSLIKAFATPRRLASYTAQGIARAVNSSKADTQEKIARVAAVADKASETTGALSKLLADGKLDDAEVADIAEMMIPLYENILCLL